MARVITLIFFTLVKDVAQSRSTFTYFVPIYVRTCIYITEYKHRVIRIEARIWAFLYGTICILPIITKP